MNYHDALALEEGARVHVRYDRTNPRKKALKATVTNADDPRFIDVRTDDGETDMVDHRLLEQL